MVLYKWFLERLHYTEKIQLVGAENSVYSVGRGTENFLKCPSVFVSRRHCVITFKDDNSLTIKDLDSSNGTYINQSKILKNRDIPLEPGDEIGLGVVEVLSSACYVFKLLQEEILTSPAPSIRLSDDDVLLDCQVIVLSDSDDANSVRKEPLNDSKSSSNPAASVVGFPVASEEEKQLGCDVRKSAPLANVSSCHKFLIPSIPEIPSGSRVDPKSNTLVTNTCKAVKFVSVEMDCDETFVHTSKSEEQLQTKSGDFFSCKNNVNSSHLGIEGKPFKVKEAPSEPECVNKICKIKTEPIIDSEISPVTVDSDRVDVEEKKMKGSVSKSECVNICKIKVETKCENEISDIGTAGTASEDSKNILRINNKLDDTLRETVPMPIVSEDRNSIVYDNNVNILESNKTIFPQDFYSGLKESERNKELPSMLKCEKSFNSEDLLRKISSPSSQPIVKLVRLDDEQLKKISSDLRSSSDSVGDYTLEDDVVIISDDDDDDVIALPVSGANVKAEPIEVEDSAEEAGSDSDNEWWPKLSQSFLESIEQEEAEMQNEETSTRPPDDELDNHDIFTSSGKRKSLVLSEDEGEESAADGLVCGEIFSTSRKRKHLEFSGNEDEISTDINAAKITDCQDQSFLSSCLVTKDLEKVDHSIEDTTDVPKHIESISLPSSNYTSKERDHGFIKRNNGTHAQNLDLDSLVKKKMETSAHKFRKPVLIDAPPMHPKHSRRKETEKNAPKRKSGEDDNKKKNEDDKNERSADSSASTVVSKKKRWKTSSSPQKSKCNPLPTSDKKKIHDMRKEKLKALASQSKSVSPEQIVNRAKAKVPIKNTKLSRGDILVEDLVPSYKVSRETIAPSSSSSSSLSSDKPSIHTTVKSTSTIKENGKLKVSAPLPDRKMKSLSREVTESKTGPKQSIRDLPRIPKKNKESMKPTILNNSGQMNSDSLSDPLRNLFLGCEQLGKEMNVLENSKTQLRPSLLLTSSVHTQPGSSGSKGKLKKRVSFKCDGDLSEIKFIPVENFSALRPVGASVKDAPVHRSSCSFQSRDLSMINVLDETLFTVCNWNVKWLQEQKGSSKPPPCYGNVQLCPMLTSFSSYADYYRIANPLMLLTLWAKICDESIRAESRSLPNVVTLDKVEEKITGDNKYMLIRCHVLLTTNADRNQIHPYTGDLCQLDIYLDPTTAPQDDHNLIVAESQGSTVHCVRLFAYVESIHKESYSTNSNPAWAHVKAEQRPTCKLNIIMKMKYKDCIRQNYKLKLRVLCNIRNELRVFEAVAMLPKSRLCNQILNPMKHDYLLPSVEPRKQHLVLKEISLNESQKKAVLQSAAMCLKSSPKIGLIQGPPGTGKSTVIVNIIVQILYGDQNYVKNYRRGSRPRILLCAPSNAAVDELVTRLLSVRQTFPKEERFRMVRVGRMAAMRHNVREISLQELTKRDMKQARFEGETMESVEIEIRNQEAKCRSYEISLESARKKNTDVSLYLKKIADIMKKISQLKNMSLNKAEQQVDKRLERQSQIKILSGADIVATTLGSCSLSLVSEVFGRGGEGQTKFTCCILDEATQCCEPEGLLPLMLGIEKLILVGDPEQLPATVVSKEAQNYGYGQSLFTRIWNKFLNDPGSPIQFLNVQHRMDPEICLWPSQYFYNNSLITSQSRPAKHVPLKPYVVLSEEFTQTSYNEIVNQNEAKLNCAF
ncbi:uncharacterized protein Setx isoform X2 [Anabrus simplex]|uniref:uncharacterized protein Setx isoform X2 n=1 Tax=Anabrus simplex TaxID=316456 RepID=UPI0035A33549